MYFLGRRTIIINETHQDKEPDMHEFNYCAPDVNGPNHKKHYEFLETRITDQSYISRCIIIKTGSKNTRY